MSKSKGKSKKVKDFEPDILVFCCNWCSYAGADLAGVSRFQYPPNIRVIRVMCSGRVDPSFILKAIKDGADGVLISGCHIGDCHYISGNEYARDVVYRYSIMRAMEGDLAGNYVIKKINYVQKSEAKKWDYKIEEIYSNHQKNKKLWRKAKKHITIFITKTINAAEKLANELMNFLIQEFFILLTKSSIC